MSYQNFLEKLQKNVDDDLNFFKKIDKSKKEKRLNTVTGVFSVIGFTVYAIYAISSVTDIAKDIERRSQVKVAVLDTKKIEIKNTTFTDQDMKILQKAIEVKEKNNSLSVMNEKYINKNNGIINEEVKSVKIKTLEESVKKNTNEEQYKQIIGVVKGLSDIEKQLNLESKNIPSLSENITK